MSQGGRLGAGGSVGPDVPTEFVTDAGTAVPALNILNVVGAGGISTSGSGDTLTITGSAGSLTWNLISANGTLTTNNGYFAVSPGGALILALPAVSAVGDTIIVSLDGATSFTLAQSAGQSIRFGNVSSTAGVGGSVVTTQQGDTLTIVCSIANLKWNVISSEGNFVIV